MQSKEFFEAKRYEDDVTGAWVQALLVGDKTLAAEIKKDLDAAQARTISLFDPTKEPMWIEMRESLGLPVVLR